MKPCQLREHETASRVVNRRTFLEVMGTAALASAVSSCASRQTQSPIFVPPGSLGIPGPYPGKVVEVAHTGSVFDGKRNREAVHAMVERGMQKLVTGSESAVDAWRYFFQKGDRVGIKVVPVGRVPIRKWDGKGPTVDLERPGSISSYEVVHEVVEGLKSAGVRPSDILVFERFRSEFIKGGYRDMLPDGVHWACASAGGSSTQLEIDGQVSGQSRQSNVVGYDPDVFRELAFCLPHPVHDVNDERRFRSHLTKIVTQSVDKFISIPVLKDHRSAGVTLALKNLSHGLVNNVGRSHIVMPDSDYERDERGSTMNQCQTFIPAMVSLPPIREKAVLQILDGLVGTYEGGPGAFNRSFSTWEYKSLFFATDPVAMDHVGWEIIDAKRVEMGWPPVARMGIDAESGVKPEITDESGRPLPEIFHIRQPQHVQLAKMLGLGVFDMDKIQHRRIDLA